MLKTIKITPLITYDFALELTRNNMQFYYKNIRLNGKMRAMRKTGRNLKT